MPAGVLTFSRITMKAYGIFLVLGLLLAAAFYLLIVPTVHDEALEKQEQSALALLDQAYFDLESEARWLQQYEEIELRRHQSQLENVIQVAIGIAESVQLGEHDEARADEDPQAHAIEHINNLRFGKGNYVWVITDRGMTLSHPNPRLVGTDVSNLLDAEGKPVIRPFLEQLRTKEQASNRYLFPRAGADEPIDKLSFARKFEPWGWIIGSGVYLDDVQEAVDSARGRLVNRMNETLKKIHLGKSGYFFVFDSQQRVLAHPRFQNDPKKGGNPGQPEALNTLLKQMAASVDNGVSRYDYRWNHPTDRENYDYEKIAWIRYSPSFDWYVCASIYESDFNEEADRVARDITATAFVFWIIGISLGLYAINLGLKPIRTLARAAEGVTRGDYDQHIDLKRSDEIGLLANAFNNMLAHIRGDINGYILAKEHAEESARNKHRMLLQAKRSEQEMSHQAYHDPLTGLANRKYFNQQLAISMAQGQRSEDRLALLFIDLDHFKEVNDNLGHGVGDELLCAVSKRLEARIRHIDTLARLGGDEFIVLMNQLPDPDDVLTLAEDLLRHLREPFHIREFEPMKVEASIGISLFPDHGTNPQELVGYADSAMYQAKRAGRNRICIYNKARCISPQEDSEPQAQ
ncbi:MAG: diguanylate cyclase [Sedimenticola sp.]